MRLIEKKIAPESFAPVIRGAKNFELRKDEDDINVGDILLLREYINGAYTGNETLRLVNYVLRDYPGLEEGYCIISFRKGYAIS